MGTTISHCLVKYGIAHEGTKEDIVAQLATWRFKGKRLFFTMKRCPEIESHSYSSEIEYEQIVKNITETIFNKLIQSGYKHYKQIL